MNFSLGIVDGASGQHIPVKLGSSFDEPRNCTYD